jgi:thiamine-monophosphate kinase
MNLARMGEIRLLDWIRGRAGGVGKGLAVGIGDDAAAFRCPPGKTLLVTADMMMEGVHFDLRYTTPYQLGFKLASANASDICAMGGAPLYATFELGAPPETDSRFIERLFDGLIESLGLHGARLAGGDLSSSKGGLALSMSMIGSAKKAIRRRGAQVGDGVFVTGPLGDAACGLEILKRLGRPVRLEKGGRAKWEGMKRELLEPLIRRHLMPVARKSPSKATAMIDVSDGLFIDLHRLCTESGVGAGIYEDRIPLSDGLREAAERLGADPLKFACSGGEDYELLYTAPKGSGRGFLIGEIVSSGLYVVGPGGRRRKFGPSGYEHFRG